MMQKSQHTIKIIAHRGDTSQFPENTIEAFEAARLGGADSIELDVHMTSDGELVVHHDYYLGNPDNGTGKIPDVTYSYIQSLVIKPNHHIPTLDEVFAKFGNLLHYEIEIKAYAIAALDKIVETVQRHNVAGFIEFTSPHPFMLVKLKELDSPLVAGYLAPPQPDWMDDSLYQSINIAHAKIGGLDVLHCQSSTITKEFVRATHAADLRIHAADCDDEKELQRVIDLGIDQLSTNQLSLALEVSAARMKVSRR
jgi:glycerophosphoryl diester phosphodiesterase